MKKKIILCLFSILIIVSVLASVPVFAEEANYYKDENGNYTDGYTVFEAYELPEKAYITCRRYFHYYTENYDHVVSDGFEYDSYYFIAIAKDVSGFIFEPDFCDKVYLYGDGLRVFEDFKNGNYYFGKMSTGSLEAEISVDTLERLENEYYEGTLETIDISGLRDSYYKLSDCSKYDLLSIDCGYIFKTDGKYCYIPTTALGVNNYYADGTFALKGTLETLVLEGDLLDIVKNAENSLDYYEYDCEPLEDTEEYPSYEDNVGVRIFFWVNYCILGFAIPIVPLIFGILLANSKKHGRKKRWFALPILALAWIFIAIVLVLIMLI